MTLPCSSCMHHRVNDVAGRDHYGCMRPGLTPDGKVIRPPKLGFSIQFERAPSSTLDWRAPLDQCGPEGRHHTNRLPAPADTL
jgi:hypothetical protein